LNKTRSLTEGISVVITAFNSRSKIESTLQALSRCSLPSAAEVILVDNNSADGTSEFASSVWRSFGRDDLLLRIVNEEKAGLSYARRAGVRASRYSVIIFCDDDNWLSKDYLEHAWRIMLDESVGAAGGCGIPSRPGRLPAWFYTLSWGYAVGTQMPAMKQIPEYGEPVECEVASLWGAGLVVRRKALEYLFSLPDYPILSGRKEEALTSGEDSEISFCLRLAGYRLMYSDHLQYVHDIGDERLRLDYAEKLFQGFKTSFDVIRQYRQIGQAIRNPLSALLRGNARIIKHLMLGTLNKGSFLSVLAALRLKWLLSSRERKVYENVKKLI